MAWKTADDAWHQWAAMAHQYIIFSLPDSILMLCMHLDTPLEMFTFLEKHFGLIPRPDSWLATEEGTQQSDLSPEQIMAEEESFLNSPNDCTETQSGYPIPETKVIDMQGVENNLPVEEEGLLGNQNAWTEIPTGYLEPETDIVDVQWTEGCLLVVEVGKEDSEWPSECTNALDAADEASQHADDEVAEHRDLPDWSAEAPELAGNTATQTSKHFIESMPKTHLGQEQSLLMSGETILDVPGPLPNAQIECPIPQDKLPV
ncbi:hypothetical protein EDC04DRAFT_2914899 [Pisolithus marmoratus]|nr:hypothetical protein EDC04DRAFT_2914899 [Pisolithus marmoratus]